MRTLTDFLQRLKERKLVQWSLAYAAGAFAVLQGLDIVAQQFGWPEGARRGITIALTVGFFVALVLAWYHGERGAQRVSGTELLIIALLLAIGGGVLWRFVRAPVAPVAPVAATAATAAPSAKAAAASAASDAKSIAVLPFDDLSPAHDQAYFSDGIAEELLNALAKVQGLKVAGRASSSYYKGRNLPLVELGKALDVATVLEGAVRKQGERVRISARLTRIGDSQQLWADSYDGDLQDVFALQERIARSIADKLQLLLSDKQHTQLVDSGTANPEAYQLYLQATSIFNRRDRARFLDAIAALQRAVELDPHYARAFARLASMYVVLASYTDADPQQTHEQTLRYAADALALDANMAEAWAARGGSLSKFRGTQVEARDAFVQATRIKPDDPNVSFWNGLNLLTIGYRRQGTAQIDHALALDPLLPNALRWRGMLYLQDGDIARAEPLLQRSYDLGLANTANALSDLVMLRGDAEGSQRLWVTGSMGLDFGMTRDELVAVHRGIYGDTAARRAGVQTVQAMLARLGPKKALPSAALYLFRLDAPSQGLTALRERDAGDHIDSMNWIWTRQGAAIRALPEFADFLRDFHLPELWDKYGPPDACRKGGDGHYVCE